ncbi:type II membrane protein [Phlebopus sp. FC_14]|nr:type II membrane protein [Phlebopus sp. FC_14]
MWTRTRSLRKPLARRLYSSTSRYPPESDKSCPSKMSLRGTLQVHHVHLLSLLLVLSVVMRTAAQDSEAFNCHLTVGELNYDLTSLGGLKILTRTRESPPSTYEDELRFDLCGELQLIEDRTAEDQCPSGTKACLTTINKKGENSDRITAVIPVAKSDSTPPDISALSSSNGLSVTLHGTSYPSNPSQSVGQSFRLSLTCAESTSEPQFVSYEDGQVLVEWSSPSACASTEPPPKEDDRTGGGSGGNGEPKPIESVGSGLGFFFLMLLLAFATYFALGAYYNYSTYGARGMDLIPHRDFWREVPYMLQDVVAHLCSNVRPRRSSRGYIAV